MSRVVNSSRSAFVFGVAGGGVGALASIAALFVAEEHGLLTKIEDAVRHGLARRGLNVEERGEYDRLRAEVAATGPYYELESRSGYRPDLLGVAPAGTALDDLEVTQLLAEIRHVHDLVAASRQPWDSEKFGAATDHLAALRSQFRRMRWSKDLAPLDKLRLEAATELLYKSGIDDSASSRTRLHVDDDAHDAEPESPHAVVVRTGVMDLLDAPVQGVTCSGKVRADRAVAQAALTASATRGRAVAYVGEDTGGLDPKGPLLRAIGVASDGGIRPAVYEQYRDPSLPCDATLTSGD
jgi:hypothetical protein